MRKASALARADWGRTSTRSAPALLALLALAQIPAPAKASEEVAIHRLTLGWPVLTDARGVIGQKHSYQISASWHLTTFRFDDQVSYLKNQKTDKRGWYIYYTPSLTLLRSGLYVGSGRWDRKSGEFIEKVDLIEGTDLSKAKANYFGTRVVKAKCAADPYLGPGLCQNSTVQWDIPSWSAKPGPLGIALAFDQMRKDFAGQSAIDLAMAEALSQTHKDEPGYEPPVAAGTTPDKPEGASVGVQPPPPGGTVGPTKPATVGVAASPALRGGAADNGPRMGEPRATGGVAAAPSQRTTQQPRPRSTDSLVRSGSVAPAEQQLPQPTLLAFEAEQLVQSGKASANAGNLSAQPMDGFGPGWSGDAQLFWSGGAPGATLDLTFELAAPGTYAVEIQWTRAPDYADLSVAVDGVASSSLLGGYAASVQAGAPTRVGEFSFEPGPHRVRLTIAGKDREATNYFAGIDRILFNPMP